MSKSIPLLLVMVFLIASCFAASVPVKAEARTIVVPDDYPEIEVAIANANNGDTIFVKEGTYEGPINQTIVIDKTLSIVGENAENTIIKLYPAYNGAWTLTTVFFNFSDAITITADDCKLLNLTVIIPRPSGYISTTGNRTIIMGNTITTSSMTGVTVNGSYCKITDNVMSGRIQLNGSFNEIARNSIPYIHLDGSWNIIKDNVCEHIGLGYYSNNTNNNVISENRVAATDCLYSGIELTYSNNNFFYRNQISGYIQDVRLWFSSGNTIVANTLSDPLGASISLGGSFNNKVYLNNFVDNVYDYYTDPNIRAAEPNMIASINFWDNGEKGNYWDAHNGSDVNGDGIGDTPYIIDANNQDHYPLMTQVDINSVSIQLPEWALNLPPEPQDTELQQIEPFPTTIVVASIVILYVVGLGLLLYFKKRKR
jgi:parallel beta-helix repeat protein